MTWDEYFLSICDAVSQNSKCLSRKIGAILVYDKSILSTGYNGPPRGVLTCDQRWFYDLKEETRGWDDSHWESADQVCPRYVLGYNSGEGLDICIAGHAERNALINAARHGIQTAGCKMYMNCSIPCRPCLVEIINAGIEEIITTDSVIYEKNEKTTWYLLNNSSLKWRVYEHLE